MINFILYKGRKLYNNYSFNNSHLIDSFSFIKEVRSCWFYLYMFIQIHTLQNKNNGIMMIIPNSSIII